MGTVAVVFFVARPRFGSRVALTAAAILAVMTWHIHFSRIGFGVIWWPLAVLVGVGAIARATEREEQGDWLLAGAAVSLGIYAYSAHWIVGVSMVLFSATWMVTKRPVAWSSRRRHAAMFGLGALIVAWPMFSYILDRRNGYSSHFDLVDRRSGDEWMTASAFGKVELASNWYYGAWNQLLFNPTVDGADGTGFVPPIQSLIVLAFLVGSVLLLARHRTSFVGLVAVLLVVLPLASAFTVDGNVRRDFAMAPLIAIVAAAGLVWIYGVCRDANPAVARFGAAAFIAVVAVSGVAPYFGEFADSNEQRYIFATELDHVIDLVAQAESEVGDVEVYFMSPRHPMSYEVLQFQLDGVEGVDRSDEFGDASSIALEPEPRGRPLFVLVGPYVDRLPELRERYPAGRVLNHRGAEGVPVTGYVLGE